MGRMVYGKGDEWRERMDGISPLFADGTALFYTTTQPTTLNVLRQYASTQPISFLHKPNTLDRDRIVVPARWDNWGKVVVLRDGFDAKAWGEAWERDLSFEADEESETGARKLYVALVPHQVPKCVHLSIALFSLTRKLVVISGTAEPASTAQQPDARTRHFLRHVPVRCLSTSTMIKKCTRPQLNVRDRSADYTPTGGPH
ncbi:hypothetical protein BGW80DRAFT_724283 [Lactifluus volemus]|nr:hypothetical protein BGW80DRAFT_724283 [Lactifluus volemus]